MVRTETGFCPGFPLASLDMKVGDTVCEATNALSATRLVTTLPDSCSAGATLPLVQGNLGTPRYAEQLYWKLAITISIQRPPPPQKKRPPSLLTPWWPGV